jgi:hypothetical protein
MSAPAISASIEPISVPGANNGDPSTQLQQDAHQYGFELACRTSARRGRLIITVPIPSISTARGAAGAIFAGSTLTVLPT